ncbi:hypothetical protein FJTKL_11532 [Diaporthe vaccinii]|uniref:Uncharacterized protein n=1 Tax=Diaporthe vaccinii TaxID=105482 RepID=A0ABR4EH01_9PEZI
MWDSRLTMGLNMTHTQVRNDNYLVKGPRNLTQREQEEIHDLMRGRRSEKTKAEKETPQEQQAAGKPDHEGATVTDTGGLELSPAAESPASGQEFGERGPPKLQRTGTVQSVKDLFGRIKRTLTGTGVVN